MKKHFIRVSPKDFDYSEIRLAAMEGRLYITPRTVSEEQLREEGIRRILEYVGRIDHCVSDAYRTSIGNIWKRLLHDSTTSRLFFFERNVGQRGMPNFYRVNAVVFVLRERGIYRKDEFTATRLHCLLEDSPKRTNVYMGANKYYPTSEEKKAILRFFNTFKQS